jgi:hypothetical protein
VHLKKSSMKVNKYLHPEKEEERRPQNHCEQDAKGSRHAKRHIFQNCPDDVFENTIGTPSLQETRGRPVTMC